MTTLVPTVHERLARCGIRVHVDGLLPGADVELDVGGTIVSFTASGSGSHVSVAPLDAGDEVRARQNDGSGWTPWSPAVIVEDAEVPPVSAPHLPAEIVPCTECVWVTSLVPGCKVELLTGGSVVGSGTANRHGRACVAVEPPFERSLEGRMIVCDSAGPSSTSAIGEDTPLPEPVVGSPLYGCQRIVPLSHLQKGARVRLESDTSGSLGSICSCWDAVNVRVGSDLEVGHKIRARCYWSSDECKSDGPWGDWREVVEPDEGIKPEVLEAFVEGDQVIRVSNQIPGGELTIFIADSDDPGDMGSPDSFGPRPASEEPEIALNAPLAEGNMVWVEQTLCEHTEASDAVEVLGLPDEIFAPIVLPPLHACGYRVTVTGLHAGAIVRVFQDGFPIGFDWSGMSDTLTIETLELVAGSEITARQWVGGTPSPESDPVTVQEPEELYTPRIVQPVTQGGDEVWVSGVTPGARVAVRSGGLLLGEAQSGETLVRVPTDSISGPVEAVVSLCDLELSSEVVEAIKDPCTDGAWSHTRATSRDYGTFTVNDWDDGGDFEHPIKGQLYFPAEPSGCIWPFGGGLPIHRDARNLPLVIIAHGYWLPPVPSYLGYRYLGHHLASWGMVVFSIDLDTVNNQHVSIDDPPHQSARGEIILKAVEAVLSDSDIQPHLDPDAIGLVGHSMGGEGVVVAQSMNLTRGDPFGIQGVVSIAPTQYREDVGLEGCEYFQLFGSEDYLLANTGEVLGADADVRFNGFRIHDRAERNKSHAWIQGASHDPFNLEWISEMDKFPIRDSQHQRIAKCLINVFFQKTLKGRDEYEGYLEGLILPPSIRSLPIYMQHLKTPRTVLDNFGDADAQAGLPGESLSKTQNRMSGAVNAAGPGLDGWQDVEAIGTGQCLHNTKIVELSWAAPQAQYSTAGGLNLTVPSRSLSLRICQFYQDASKNLPDQDIDLLVEISDGSETAYARLGMVGKAPYPDESMEPYSVFRSARISADAFGAVNPALDLSSVSTVRLRLISHPSGHILVDDIEVDV